MADTLIYQCPNCGAGLKFNAENQNFECEFCLSTFLESDLKNESAEEKAKSKDKADKEFCDEMNEYVCPSCGAEITTDLNTVSSFCYYCHNPVILKGRLSGQMRPDRIIPFKYDKQSAKEIFLKFAKSKWFVPNDFFADSHADMISGVYYPFWVTDADTDVSAEAKATRIRTWRTGNKRYTETSVYSLRRDGDVHFEDIVTSAYSEEDKRMLEGILPYPSDALLSFSMPYLSGFSAKKRTIERENISAEVKQRMSDYASRIMQSTMNGYATVDMQSCNVNIKKSHWEYSLFPIWILTYKSNKSKKNRVYTYAMNGHTGKVYGELPISKAKIAALFSSICAAATAIAAVIGVLL